MDDTPVRILVLGASYGLLPGLKLAASGHVVTFVGRADEIAAMAAAPLEVELPQRRSDERILLSLPVAQDAAPAKPALRTPSTVDPSQFDFVLLAMQEPQFAAPEVSRLMSKIGAARLPCLSIMNLPPPPFLTRLQTLPEAALEGVYTNYQAWKAIDPALLTLASPDALAVRHDASKPGHLTVTLASNFKAAPFDDSSAQHMLERLGRDMSHLKVDTAGGAVRPPVALLATSSLTAPLAKWPMLIAGNCRCVTKDEPISISVAVHSDLAASRVIYNHVAELTRQLGARNRDLVSFEDYARAAAALIRPSSIARALHGGATAVERIDRIVRNVSHLFGSPLDDIVDIAENIDFQLSRNLTASQSLGA